MAEYKRADEIVKNMTKKFDKNYGDTTIKGIRDVFNMCVNCVNQTPTADVVEVVRCKDCEYWHSPTNDDMHYCKLRFGLQGIVAESDFCSYGKRRSGKGDL